MFVLSIEASVPRNVGTAGAAGFLGFGLAVVPAGAALVSGTIGAGWTRLGSTPGVGSGCGMTGAGAFGSGIPGVGAGTGTAPGLAGCCAKVIEPTTKQAIK